MKLVRIISAITAVTLISTSLFTTTIFAKEQTGKLSNAKFSFNNGPTKTIQTYNVDGFNYVSLRSVTNELDMAISYVPAKGEEKAVFQINPSEPKGEGTVGKLEKENVPVKMVDAKIKYGEFATDAACFNVDGFFYVKLADIQSSSDENLIKLTTLVKQALVDKKVPEYPLELKTTKIAWDKDTSTIHINTEVVSTNTTEIANAIKNIDPSATVNVKISKGKNNLEELTQEEVDTKFLTLINEQRKIAGVKPLTINKTLTKVANFRANDMREYDYLGHVSPKYGICFNTFDAMNYEGFSTAENCALTQTVEEAFKMMFHDEAEEKGGHWANILSDESNEVGFGFAKNKSGTGYYFAQDFGFAE